MDDAAFLSAFRRQAIAEADWTHRAHVRCAYLHLREMAAPEALDAMRQGIKKLNAAHGLVETPERGYHETITRAWVTIVASAMVARGPGEDFDAFIVEHPHLLISRLLRVFYSPAGMTAGSRYAYVSPDIMPLPPPTGD